LISLLSVFGIVQTLNELDFVMRVIVFSYLLFWLYITFRDVQVLFGLSSILVGYLVFAHGVSITLLAAFFLVFVVMGTHLQMFIQFGLMPVLGFQHAGDRFAKINQGESMGQMAQLQQAVESGQMSVAEAQEMAQQMQAQGDEMGGRQRVMMH